jgi:hypothetical protein
VQQHRADPIQQQVERNITRFRCTTLAFFLYTHHMTRAMKIPTTITLEPDVRAALERAAACQDRTRSWIANRALREQLVDPQPPVSAISQQEPLSR